MIAFRPMKLRAILLTVVKLSVTGVAIGCGAHGNMKVDVAVLPYQPPDISEITGIEDDSDSEGSGSAQPGK